MAGAATAPPAPPAILAFILWNKAVSSCSAVVPLTDAGVGAACGVEPVFAAASAAAPAVRAGGAAGSVVAAAARTPAFALL